MHSNKNSICKNYENLLDGTSGIVYLLFVGRDNYAQNIQTLMTESLFADRSNVNQVMHRLAQKGDRFFISKGSYRIKGQPGRARDIYTANLEPIRGTLKRLDVKFDESELTDVLSGLSATSDFFPKFLVNMYQTHVIRRFQWYQTLSMYFLFLSAAIKAHDIIAYPLPANFKVSKKETDPLLEKYPFLGKDLIGIFSQLNSPSLIFNPEYAKHLNAIADDLGSKESEALKAFKFLRGLQDLGINDISVLLEQVKAVMDLDNALKQIQVKIAEIQNAQNANGGKKDS